jgi:hypothetical protein
MYFWWKYVKTNGIKKIVCNCYRLGEALEFQYSLHWQKGYFHATGNVFFLNQDPLAKPRDIRKELTDEVPLAVCLALAYCICCWTTRHFLSPHFLHI